MKFDTYTFQARILPAIFLLLPVILQINYIIVALDFHLAISTTIANFVLFLILTLFANWTRYIGRKKEKKLFLKWGGAPTTRFLRYANTEFNPYKREEVRKYLKMMFNNIKMPTRQEETNDPIGADKKYEAFISNIKALTRDHKKFTLLYGENKNYGMWRNLYGLKVISIIMLALLIVANAILAVFVPKIMTYITAGVLTCFYILLLIVWIFAVTEAKVKDVSGCYAERLFEAVIMLNNK